MSKRDDIAKELEIIRNQNSGVLRPVDVVDYARNKNTALHDQFTWDDDDAAEKYRLWEARMVIRIHVQVVDGDNKPIRAYVSLTSDRKSEGGGYRALSDVMTNADMRAEALAQFLAEMELCQSKYQHLTEVAPVFEALAKVRANVKAKAKPKQKAAKGVGGRAHTRVAASPA